MKRYGRPRRKHRQNKRAKRNSKAKHFLRVWTLIAKARIALAISQIRNEVNRAAVEHLNGKFEPGGIIAKDPTELGGEYIISAPIRTVPELPPDGIKYVEPMEINEVILRMRERLSVVKELTLDEQLKEIERSGSRRHWVTTVRPAQNLPPEE